MKVNREHTYAAKRRVNGGDFYGTWVAGVQKVADRIAGRTLNYDHHEGKWRSNG